MQKPMSLSSTMVPTPIGPFHLICQGDIVYACGFGCADEVKNHLPVSLHGLTVTKVSNHPYVLPIQRYFNGELNALREIRYTQISSEFYQKVYAAISKIRPGETKTYREIAVIIGSPKAARAVGSACKRNALPLIAPCHRITKSDGTIGYYVYGIKAKQFLLNHEQQFQK